MERKTLAITVPLMLSVLFLHIREAFGSSKIFGFLLLLSCLLHPLTSSEPCLLNALHNPAEYDSCGSPGYNPVTGFQDFSVGDATESPAVWQSVCTSSDSFCFLSSLGSGNQSDPFSSLGTSNPGKSVYDAYELTNGRKVLCSQNSRDEIPLSSSVQTGSAITNLLYAREGSLLKSKTDVDVRLNDNPEMTKPESTNGHLSFSVEIKPPMMDWGEKLLFFPSVAFLTVVNKCNDSILHVYEPFSTDKQFYPCNNTGFLLSPGEKASICFVFLPRWLGLSSARLVLQTNRGGFLVHAKGFAVKSLYGAQPLISIDSPSDPWSMKKLFLFNPLDEPLYVKRVEACISISSESASLETEVSCHVETHDSLEIKSNNLGSFQMVTVKPNGNWEVGIGKREGILEMELLPNFQGRISGTVSLELLRSSMEQTDIIVFPLEVDLAKQIPWNDRRAQVSVFLDPLVSDDSAEMVIAISLKNDAPFMLALVNVSQVAETSLFHIKHNKGLLLFPGSVTQVALISCAHLPSDIPEFLSDASDLNKGCVVLLLTNDSTSPEVEILCRDIFHICSWNKKVGSSDSDMSSLQFKAQGGDELILRNWRSQGVMSNMSVLKDHEVMFSMVQVGTHGTRYITVRNPSHEPVVMQLILNSAEIIDECHEKEDPFHPSLSNGSVKSKAKDFEKQVFSIAENAVTEAYVYPNSESTFGPIHFHPSMRCRWRSSALIRNNLSGVEWISLKGLGGSLSLILLEHSEPIHSIEFQPDLPRPLNMSPLRALFDGGDVMCYTAFSKELYAKNSGDLPLQVQSISISGTRCGGDGFVVENCKGFSLKPGESIDLLLSYHMDLSASTVHKDLEFALASGVILAVPMKASIPVLMLNICKRTLFWMRLKKVSMAVLATASLFLLLYFVFPQMTAIILHDRVAIRRVEKSSTHFQQKHSFTISPEMDSLLRSMRKETLRKMNNGQDGVSENDSSTVKAQDLKPSGSVSVVEVSEPVNLTVKIAGRDKKKRRKKKKKGGMVNGLSHKASPLSPLISEASSSNSGNSTPTSPISPLISATTEVDHLFKRVVSKPSILSHSATFPCTTTRLLNIQGNSSPLAPHARAPGRKLGSQESRKSEGKRKEEMYDIWGDHLTRLNLMDRFKEVREGKSCGFSEDESDSFFLKGPQSFSSNFHHHRYVSLFNPPRG